jgi:hypothetical protein
VLQALVLMAIISRLVAAMIFGCGLCYLVPPPLPLVSDVLNMLFISAAAVVPLTIGLYIKFALERAGMSD